MPGSTQAWISSVLHPASLPCRCRASAALVPAQPQDHSGRIESADSPIGIPERIFSIKARFINCSSARTRVVCT